MTEKRQITDSQSILERASELDDQALTMLHDQHYPIVYRYVHYRLEDEQLVEDISGEVFLRFLDALRRKMPIRNVRAWLVGTAANLVNDHLRKKYRHPVENLEEHEELPMIDTPEGVSETNDRHRHLHGAVSKLTSDQQQVLTLRFALECSVEETARVMKRSAGAVKVLQFRALGALRKLLEGGEAE